MRRLVRASIQLFIPAILLFIATTAFALPGDPPLWGGDCGDEAQFHKDDPDLPIAVSVVNKLIRDQSIKMYEAKAAPYMEVDPQTGNKVYRRRYQPQIDAISREVMEWERRAKDKVEKYAEVDPCPKSMGLVIRMKYLDLLY